MFGFRKTAPKEENTAHSSVSSTPSETTLKPERRTSSAPVIPVPKSKGNYFDDDDDDDDWGRGGRKASATSSSSTTVAKRNYKNDFKDSGGLENQSVQELENYAVHKAEETTKDVKNCLRIAEDIRGDATRTLDMLHQQGEQIHRTHNMIVETEKDLSRGEKLLNNLGGMFSMPWRPKKTREIKGPVITPDKPSKTNDKQHKENREKLCLNEGKGKAACKTSSSEPGNAYQKIEMETNKQDDALDNLSNILGDLKGIAADMGSELDRQNKALDHLSDDVDELNSRVKGSNQRARKLLAS